MSIPNNNIEIKVKRWVDRDNGYLPKVTILNLWALEEELLPKSYIDAYPHCCMRALSVGERECRTMVIRKSQQHVAPRGAVITKVEVYTLAIGKTYDKAEYDEIVTVLGECAKRLHEVKKQEREMLEENKRLYRYWNGESLVSITV